MELYHFCVITWKLSTLLAASNCRVQWGLDAKLTESHLLTLKLNDDQASHAIGELRWLALLYCSTMVIILLTKQFLARTWSCPTSSDPFVVDFNDFRPHNVPPYPRCKILERTWTLPTCIPVSLSIVLASWYIWLLSSAPPDHDWSWNSLFPHSKAKLELHKQISSMFTFTSLLAYLVYDHIPYVYSITRLSGKD